MYYCIRKWNIKMKIKLIISMGIILISTYCYSQTQYSYTYDGAGNRITRTVVSKKNNSTSRAESGKCYIISETPASDKTDKESNFYKLCQLVQNNNKVAIKWGYRNDAQGQMTIIPLQTFLYKATPAGIMGVINNINNGRR